MMLYGAAKLILFGILLFIGLFRYYPRVKAGFEGFQCEVALAAVHEESFSSFGECGQKYQSKVVSHDDKKNQCFGQIIESWVWEEANNQTGCLNSKCCVELKETLVWPYQFILFLIIYSGVLGLLNYASLSALFTQLFKKHKEFLENGITFVINHGAFEKILGVLIIIFSGLAIFYSILGSQYTVQFKLMPNLIDSKPIQFDSPIPEQLIQISQRHLTFDGYFDIFDIEIFEDTSACATSTTHCGQLNYTVNLTVSNGALRFNPSFDPSTKISYIQTNQGKTLWFNGPKANVNQGLDLFEYLPDCPFNEANTLEVKITALPSAPGDKSQLWGQIVSADMGEAIVINGKTEQIILQKQVSKISYIFIMQDCKLQF
ncbi:hypothetical protein FGO68_gene8815 [Halteria grandinella]|uniref:Uncharacterized protein n=1 Tax=Halteria grandinella TaxID=5974 RepID=A0A8J8P3N3_HALGN|nr:hypothetical protein FGO68_gene8815 [Halteria grandinella]